MAKIGKIQAVKISKNAISPKIKGTKGKESFKEIINRFLGDDKTLNDIDKIQKQINTGVKFKPEQLLAYQIRAGKLHLRVELVSKVAESANSTTKRLQSSQ